MSAKKLFEVVRALPGEQVTFTLSDGSWLEITSGLDAGTEVAVTAVRQINDGMPLGRRGETRAPLASAKGDSP